MSLNRPTGTSTSERMTQAEMGALVQAIAEKLDVTVTPTPTGTRAPMNSTPRPGAANAMARAGIAAAALPVLAALF